MTLYIPKGFALILKLLHEGCKIHEFTYLHYVNAKVGNSKLLASYTPNINASSIQMIADSESRFTFMILKNDSTFTGFIKIEHIFLLERSRVTRAQSADDLKYSYITLYFIIEVNVSLAVV